MKKKLLITCLLLVPLATMAEKVEISAKNIALVLDVNKGKAPTFLYFGNKLNKTDLNNISTPTGGRMEAYPAYGMNAPAEAALAVTHADGNMSTELVATGFDVKQDGKTTITVVHLKDKVYPFYVDLNYKEIGRAHV